MWTTVDNYAGSDGGGSAYYAFTTDSNGNLYAGGYEAYGWMIRSAPAPILGTFSSASITDNSVDGPRVVEDIFAT